MYSAVHLPCEWPFAPVHLYRLEHDVSSWHRRRQACALDRCLKIGGDDSFDSPSGRILIAIKSSRIAEISTGKGSTRRKDGGTK